MGVILHERVVKRRGKKDALHFFKYFAKPPSPSPPPSLCDTTTTKKRTGHV